MIQASADEGHTRQGAALDRFLAALLDSEYIDERGLDRARRVAEREGQRVDRVLNQLGLLSDEHFAEVWSLTLGLEMAKAVDYPADRVWLDEIPDAFLRDAQVLPLRLSGGTLTLAIADPLDDFAIEAIHSRTGFDVERRMARPLELAEALDRVLAVEAFAQHVDGVADHEGLASDVERLREGGSEAPVIRFVQTLLEKAIGEKASDIHLTAGRAGATARLRIDGMLREITSPPFHLYPAVVSRLKLIGGLDIAESRLPQDGSARVVVRGKEVDVRIATMPHFAGEGVVIRILDRAAIRGELDELGVSSEFVGRLRQSLQQPSGLILMTGPTGSGKTTTLYAALKSIARTDRNIVTIEDPIEYQLDGITQIEINHRIGFDFAKALRAVLRQDPDVILVGEIRDGETASIAARAAMTGHLVLASLHANSALEALPRLVDMGVEPYVLASVIRAIMAQRLARRLCAECADLGEQIDVPTGVPSRDLGHSGCLKARGKPGCAACDGSGYRGRVAVTEFVAPTRRLREALARAASAVELASLARDDGVRTLAESGLELVRTGVTSADEIQRVLGASCE